VLFLFAKEHRSKSAVPFCKGTAEIHTQKVLFLFAKEQQKFTLKSAVPFRKGAAKPKCCFFSQRNSKKIHTRKCCSFSQRNSKAKVLFLFAKEQQKFILKRAINKRAVPFRKGTAKQKCCSFSQRNSKNSNSKD